MALLKDFKINFRAPALPYAPNTYVSSAFDAPTLLTTIAEGDVYEYTYVDGTAYRLVPSGAAEDAFYNTFSGGVLSDKIVGRGMSL
jgi:hypothetical protein